MSKIFRPVCVWKPILSEELCYEVNKFIHLVYKIRIKYEHYEVLYIKSHVINANHVIYFMKMVAQ